MKIRSAGPQFFIGTDRNNNANGGDFFSLSLGGVSKKWKGKTHERNLGVRTFKDDGEVETDVTWRVI